ncbi:hypothetical protein CK203_102769 [Vitis vinifera]|uniref:Uncharacterized protein n=1 Tax=Vitis vinifera TaxID=29760 RepID=A0A438FFD1_VITVI|nr:hypothetical protein CK203_102769 [Vitis vinifera]
MQEKGKFPSQPHQNPKAIHEVEAQEGESSQMREVKAVITLRSGKEVDLPTPKPNDDWKDMWRKLCWTWEQVVNLLPYSVYKQLGLGELKPTSITLSLADRSVKIPRGTNYIPIILGRPFLATSNAIINCRNGVMLTFGNMTLELNIFYMCNKQFHREKKKDRREILPLFNEEETQEAEKEEPPKFILKPLSIELKYAYLEENKESPVVISSSLTTTQRGLST